MQTETLTTPAPSTPPTQPGAGAALIAALEALADAHPDHADVLEAARQKVRNRTVYTAEHRLRVIVRKLEEGCTTIAEIRDETGWKKGEILTDLMHLIDAGIVEERPARDAKNNSGRGGRTVYYFLKNASAFKPLARIPRAATLEAPGDF